jgi:hypothetical protein
MHDRFAEHLSKSLDLVDEPLTLRFSAETAGTRPTRIRARAAS